MEASQNRYENWISNHKFTSWMNSFVNSEWFIILIGILVLISDCFAQEVICFGLVALLSTLALVFSKDTKPLIFVILTFQMAMSYKNGISYNPDPELPTIYDNQNIMNFFYIIGGIVIASVFYNFIIFKQYKNKWSHLLPILPGLICLSVGYILGGSIGYFSINNIVYASSNVLMILGLYIYFSFTSFQNKNIKPIKYISKIMLYSSILIGLELIHIYITNDVINNMEIFKNNIKNGWGIHNNFAGYFCLSIPFIIYLILKEKNNIRYYIATIIIFLFTIMTLSRNGIAIIILELLASLITIYCIKKEKRKHIIIICSCLSIIAATIIGIFHKDIFQLLSNMFEQGFDLSGREKLYKKAWKSFINNPIFGQGWFIFENMEYGNYVPPTSFAPNFKGHNIILQLLGCTGIVGLLGFIAFVSFTLYFILKNATREKTFLALGIFVLIISSILDNFFFDYGFERYLAIFLVGIAIELKKEKEGNELIETKEAPVNE